MIWETWASPPWEVVRLTPKPTLTNLGHRPEPGRCSVKSNGTGTYGDLPPKIGPIGRSVSSKVAQIDRVSMTFFKFPLVIHQPCAMRQFYFISDIYPHTAISAKKRQFLSRISMHMHTERDTVLSVCLSVRLSVQRRCCVSKWIDIVTLFDALLRASV